MSSGPQQHVFQLKARAVSDEDFDIYCMSFPGHDHHGGAEARGARAAATRKGGEARSKPTVKKKQP